MDTAEVRTEVVTLTPLASVVERYITLRHREPGFQPSSRLGSRSAAEIGLHDASSRFIGDCPLCDVTGDQGSFSVYETTWFCDHCEQHGDVVAFTAAAEGISEISALERLAVQCGL